MATVKRSSVTGRYVKAKVAKKDRVQVAREASSRVRSTATLGRKRAV